MTPQVVCRTCHSANPVISRFCKQCGGRLRSRLTKLSWVAWSAAMVAWSLFTINLVSITKPVLFPMQNETVLSGPGSGPVVSVRDNNGPVQVQIYSAPQKPWKPGEVKQEDFLPDVTDKKGAHAGFVIYLFSDEYRWRLGSWDVLESGEVAIPFTEQMRTNLNSAVEVICIGASSEEIRPGLSEVEGRKDEESRARRRAEGIAVWIRPHLYEHVRVRKLNIGHHSPEHLLGERSVDTSDQRRIIIVLVLKEQEGVDLDEALRKGFEQEARNHPIYETILTKYSLTGGARFAWVE